MIIVALFLIIGVVFDVIFWLFLALINSIPVVNDMYASLISMVSTFKGAIVSLPYLDDVYWLFIFAIFIEIILWIIKLVLGARDPSSNNG